MIEDKEYPVHVTDDMMLKYEKMVLHIYNRYYRHSFAHLEKDLLQCGRWGLWLAYQRYEKRGKDKCGFDMYAYLHIRNKMCQYLDHEKHHIQEDSDESYDFSQQAIPQAKDVIFEADMDAICDKLDNKNKDTLRKFLQGYNLSTMNTNTRQAAHYRFNKIKRTIKEYYNEQ